MIDTRTLSPLVGILVLTLAGCIGGGGGDTGDADGPATTQRIVERDVEAPEVFQATDRGVWDGRPSLGGVWVAHPDTGEPERVIIRNEDTAQFVIGALFRREREMAGPTVQVSSDAAEALGMVAGDPATLNITALRSAAAPADEAEDATDADTAPVEGETLAAAETIAAAPLDDAAPVTEAAPAAAPVETASAPQPASSLSRPYIQIGIFSQEENASNTATSLRGIGVVPTIKRQETAGATFYRVIVGPAPSEADRADALDKVKGLGFEDAYFVSG